MATTEILPFVTNAPGTANVLSQAAYVALTSIRANGYTADSIAESDLVNKVQRQSSFISAGLANFCVAQGISVPDDGDVSGLVTNITNALKALLLTRSNNLSDLTNVATARTNLGLGTAATTAASAYDPAGAASAVQALALLKANNLSDLTNKATARTNLQLGSAALSATSDFDAAGTATTAVAALQALVLLKANNLSDLPNKATARTNLQLGSAALNDTADFDASGSAALRLLKTANLSDLASIVTARNNLGLDTAALQSAGFFLQVARNLGDLANTVTARNNLGLGSAAVQDVTAFLRPGQNLGDIANAAISRTNLGLGTAATHATADFDTAGAAASALASAKAYADAEGFGPSLQTVDVTGSRNFGTIYSNSSGRSKFVSAYCKGLTNGDNMRFQIDTHDGTGMRQVFVTGQQLVGGGAIFGVIGFVPNGANYMVDLQVGGFSQKTWYETF